jgi:hypothetical protein
MSPALSRGATDVQAPYSIKLGEIRVNRVAVERSAKIRVIRVP